MPECLQEIQTEHFQTQASPRRRFTIFASCIWHNPFLTHPHVWACFLQFFNLLISSPWLCRTHAFVLFLKMECSPSKPAIPWAPERLKVSSVSWSSISWSSCRCSTQREVLVLLGLCPSCTGKSGRSQIPVSCWSKHISRFRTHIPGYLCFQIGSAISLIFHAQNRGL